MIVAVVGLAACAEREGQVPTRPTLNYASPPFQGRGTALERFPELMPDLPAVAVFAVGDAIPRELTDAELVDAVTRAGGEVFIGLKPASARRTRETGVVPGTNRAAALAGRAAVQAVGAVITLTYRYTSAVAATIPPEAAPRLRRLPMVDYIEARFPGRVQAQDTSWGVKKVQAQHVWTGGDVFPPTRGEGVSVTILDTGLDEMHLTSGDGPANVTAEGCLYVGNAGGSTCYDIQTDLRRKGHGAHVAGIIAARDNSLGFIGVANNVSEFESIRVCNAAGWCDPAWVVAGLDWVRAMRIYRPRQVVNMSLGYCQNYTALSQAVSFTYDAGVLLIAAAGNRVKNAGYDYYCGNQTNHLRDTDWQNSVMFPAAYSQVMAVSGTLQNDQFAFAPPDEPGGGGEPPPSENCPPGTVCNPTGGSCLNYAGSRYGPEIEIAAPFEATSMWTGGTYYSMCGTSMSAPVVAGVAALVWSHYPGWTAAQVRLQLRATAVYLGSPTYFGYGRVNAFNSVFGLFSPPPPPTATITGPSEMRPLTACTFTAATTLPDEPYTYAWFVDGAPVSWYESSYRHTAGGSSFVLSVTVQNSQGRQVYTTQQVAVSESAAECLDQ